MVDTFAKLPAGAERCQGRRHFTDKFKREAVALLVSSDRPLSRIAGELGISVSDPAAEISWLRRENDRLRRERDILKKAVAIFSEPPR